MQLNGTSTGPTMAASEPPEPPPRNPDKINASLKQLVDSVSFFFNFPKSKQKRCSNKNCRKFSQKYVYFYSYLSIHFPDIFPYDNNKNS